LEKIDVVVASSPTLFSALSAWLIARTRRVPFVMEVRDLWPEAIVDLGLMRPGFGSNVLHGLAQFLYRHAAHIVVVTRAFRERIAALGIPRDKITVIPNGADLSLFSPIANGAATREALNLNGRFVVAYVGSHGVSQGLGAVMDAAAA